MLLYFCVYVVVFLIVHIKNKKKEARFDNDCVILCEESLSKKTLNLSSQESCIGNQPIQSLL